MDKIKLRKRPLPSPLANFPSLTPLFFIQIGAYSVPAPRTPRSRAAARVASSAVRLSSASRVRAAMPPSAAETMRAWLLSALVVHSAVAGNPDAKRLYDDLLSNYNKLVRPVVNTSDVLRVCIKLKLSQLIDVVRWRKMFRFLATICGC